MVKSEYHSGRTKFDSQHSGPLHVILVSGDPAPSSGLASTRLPAHGNLNTSKTNHYEHKVKIDKQGLGSARL